MRWCREGEPGALHRGPVASGDHGPEPWRGSQVVLAMNTMFVAALLIPVATRRDPAPAPVIAGAEPGRVARDPRRDSTGSGHPAAPSSCPAGTAVPARDRTFGLARRDDSPAGHCRRPVSGRCRTPGHDGRPPLTRTHPRPRSRPAAPVSHSGFAAPAWLTPAVRVRAFTALIALVAVGLAVAVVPGMTPLPVPFAIPWPLAALGFYLGETNVVEVHFLRERHSFSLSELPGIVGLFFLPPTEYLAGLPRRDGPRPPRRPRPVERQARVQPRPVRAGRRGRPDDLPRHRDARRRRPGRRNGWRRSPRPGRPARSRRRSSRRRSRCPAGRPQFRQLPKMLQLQRDGRDGQREPGDARGHGPVRRPALDRPAGRPDRASCSSPTAPTWANARSTSASSCCTNRAGCSTTRPSSIRPSGRSSTTPAGCSAPSGRSSLLFPDPTLDAALRSSSGAADGPETMVPVDGRDRRPAALPDLAARARAFSALPGPGWTTGADAHPRGDGRAARRRGRRLGALTIINRLGEGTNFEPDDLRLLETVANQAAVALENGQLEQSLHELSRLKEELRHQAYHDSLTGLPNRPGLRRGGRAAGWPRPSTDGAPPSVVVFLDLDDFKIVNDTLGHAAGDELLVAVAERIGEQLRPDDLRRALRRRRVRPAAGGRVDGRRRAVDDPADHHRARAAVPGPGHGRRRRLQRRDQRASAATRRSTRSCATPTSRCTGPRPTASGARRSSTRPMHSSIVERHALTSDLGRSISRGELAVHYQPIVALASGRIVGVEALVRWNHPTRGAIDPDRVHPPGRGERHDPRPRPVTSCGRRPARSSSWHRLPGLRALGLSVNLSPLQLQQPGLHRRGRGGDRGGRHRPARPDLRDDRDRDVPRHPGDDRHARAAARPRHPDRDGRLRDRLLVAGLPAPLPGRQPQDRPRADRRPEPSRTTPRRGHSPGRSSPWAARSACRSSPRASRRRSSCGSCAGSAASSARAILFGRPTLRRSLLQRAGEPAPAQRLTGPPRPAEQRPLRRLSTRGTSGTLPRHRRASLTAPRTIVDKIWADHVVTQDAGAPAVLAVDLHLVHEVTSPQAFTGPARARPRRPPPGPDRRDRRPLDPDDADRSLPIIDAMAAAQVDQLEANCAEFGIPLHGIGDPRRASSTSSARSSG